MIRFSLELDLFALLAGVLASLSCALLGNFLVLRRLSLMGDVISHSVLPGLVIAFLIAGTRSPTAMFIGAATAGVATVVLVELVKRLGRVEPGAAMGVVFSVLFALGVLLIERADVRHVDLDADCVLHGQLETLYWPGAPDSISGLLSSGWIEAMPRQVWTLALMAALAAVFVSALYKELRIVAFDADLATTLGFSSTWLHYALMIVVAAATVAAFEAVGSILVIAMLICPAATARLLTDRLGSQIAWSLIVALCASVGGYLGASSIPAIWGGETVNAAGAMGVASGVLLCVAIVAGPRHGLVANALRKRSLSHAIAREDVLGALYRHHEAGQDRVDVAMLERELRGRAVRGGVRGCARRGQIQLAGETAGLTEAGRVAAADLIRRHRLWETYLVGEAGLAPDHVHDTAEVLEHVDVMPRRGAARDPHGRRIP
ncbi:MAG: metal ABC transporter permease [Planctomycetota bacterium]